MHRIIVSIWLTAAVLCAQDPTGETEPAPAPPAGEETAAAPYELYGVVELRYVGRWTEGYHDNDIFGYGQVQVGDPRQHEVTLHASGRLDWDLDGTRDPTSPFFTVDDTYADVATRLYSAYADLNAVGNNPLRHTFRRIRLGRQVSYNTPETLFLDGLSVETLPLVQGIDLVLLGYVGVPAHLFESSESHDLAFGGAAMLVPWTNAQFRFDYQYISDAYLGSTQRDDLFGFRLDQKIGSTLFASAHINLLNDGPRDLGVNAQWSEPDLGLTVTGRYTALLDDQGFQVIDLDYFTPIMGTYFQYDQFEISAQKDLGENAYVAGGVQLREMRHDSNEGLFNHEFRRYYLTPGISDWPWEGFDGNLTFEFWDAYGDDYLTYGGDIKQVLNDEWLVSTGLLYQLYRYDTFVQKERENVYVAYAKLTWDATDDMRVWGMYQYEDGDTEDFSTFMLNARLNF